MPFAILFLLLVGGGASVAAESALPGEVLYPIKTSINEKARSFVAFSDEAKASFAANLAARRLEEAENLSGRGEFSVGVRTRIEENFKRHADEVSTRVARLKVEGDMNAAADVESNFEISLRAHEHILARLSASEEGDVFASIIANVRARLSEAESERVRAEASIRTSPDVKTAAEGKLKAAENVLVQSRRFLSEVHGKVDVEAAAEAELKLRSAETALMQGKTKLEAGVYGEAFSSFQSALRLAQEAKLGLSLVNTLRFSSNGTTTSEKSSTDPHAQVETKTEVGGGSVRGEGSLNVDVGF